MKVATWNVNGIRARYDDLVGWVGRARPDIFCLQELKAAPSQVPGGLFDLSDYRGVWHGQPGGYSGVSIHVHRRLGEPRFSVPSFDRETRVLEAEIGSLTLLCVYAPNGQKDEATYQGKLEFWRAMIAHAETRRDRPFLLTGDLNIAREERDVHPKLRKPGLIGQRPEERETFERLLSDAELIDVGRRVAPDDDGLFTWWPPWREEKQKNRGWRLDYHLLSARLADAVTGCEVQREEGTSDHAPVVLSLRGDLAS